MADLTHVSGLSDLQKLLDTLPAKLEANIMRGALRAGMKTVKDKAVINIQKESGDTARALKISTKLRDGIVKSVLAAKGFEGYKAMWLEYGTRPHYISVHDINKNVNQRLSRKRGEVALESMSTVNRRMLAIGGNFIGPTVFHPGAKPHPFMRPALDSTAQEALLAVGNYIKARLQKKHGIDTSHIMIEGDE